MRMIRKRQTYGYIIIIVLSVFCLLSCRHNQSGNNDSVTINNNRVAIERMMEKEVAYQHITNLIGRDSLTNKRYAQLLADSITQPEIESLIKSCEDAGLSGKDMNAFWSCLSEETKSDGSSEIHLSAKDYEQIFSIWKTIQPDNMFLKVLEVK